MLRMLSLCAGIGGADLAAEWTDAIQVVGQVEIDPFCQQILAQHWPAIPRFTDVRLFQGNECGPIDLMVAGFPCQPHSLAGKRRADHDERDLWPEIQRIVEAARPRWFVAENVRGLLSSARGSFFGRILREMVNMGYRVGWSVYGARDIGAPHRRERVFLVAYDQRISATTYLANASSAKCQWRRSTWDRWPRSTNDGKTMANTSCQRQPIGRSGSGSTTSRKAFVDESFDCCPYVANGNISRLAIGQSLAGDLLTQCTSSSRGGDQPESAEWPLEPGLGGDPSRLSTRMDKDLLIKKSHQAPSSNTTKKVLEERNAFHGTSKTTRSSEVLSGLWDTTCKEDDQWQTRRQRCFQASEILQPDLCGDRQDNESTDPLVNLSLESKETLQESMRSMWREENSSCSPHRSEQNEQQSGKHSDSLQVLSQLLAQHSQASGAGDCGENALTFSATLDEMMVASSEGSSWPGWPAFPGEEPYDWEPTRTVLKGTPNRARRLKALGNAIVPQQIYPLFIAILASDALLFSSSPLESTL